MGSGAIAARRWARRALTRRAMAWLEWIVLGSLLALFAWKGLVPAWTGLNSDFPNYYLAARLYRAGYPLDRCNELIWFQRQKDHAEIPWGVVRYIPLTPFSALVMAPFASFAPLVAKRCWLVLDLSLLAATIALLRAMTRIPLRRLAIIAFLAVVPLRTNFQFGQQYVALLFLITLATWLYPRARGVPSGVVLAIAAALKLYPGMFLVFFLLKRKWSLLAGLGLTLLALVAVGAATFGREALHAYAVDVLPRAGAGEANHPYWVGFNTPTVLLRRLFVAEPDLNPHPLANAPAVYVLLQPCVTALLCAPACWLMIRRRGADLSSERLEWGAFLALLVLLSLQTSTYHLCVLILTTALAVDFLLRARQVRGAAIMVLLHALVSAPIYRFFPVLPSGWRIFLGVPRLYLLVAYWGVVLWTLAGVPHEPDEGRARSWKAAAVALVFFVIAVSGAASNARHFDGLLGNTALRVPVKHGAFALTAPAAAAQGLYFARMDESGFVLDRTGDGLVTQAPPGMDLFHPAAMREGQEGWVEVASDKSRIARFRLDATTINATELPVDVEDGEQPSISADGRWLGFIREHHGRGSLWVADRGLEPRSARGPFVERELVDATHDVFDFAFFPDGRIVLAARRGLGSGLFVTSPMGDTPLEKLTTSEDPARYPVVSPDGQWLAFSRKEHGSWQLQVMTLATGALRSLTNADCNSIMPAWEGDSRMLVYATDCGRDVGDTAICRIAAAP